MKPFSRSIFLEYEIRSSWLLDVLGHFLPNSWTSSYFAWKVKRKYARYAESVWAFNYLYPEITHVAIMVDGVRYSLPRPSRHHNVYHTKIDHLGVVANIVEGFLDAKGNFLTREQAMERAVKTKQLNRRKGDQYYQGPNLFSEDLW